MNFEIRLIFYIPNLSEQLTDFIQRVEKVKYLVVGFAYNHVNQRLKIEKVIIYIRQDKKPYFYHLQYDRLQQSDRYDKYRDEQYDEHRNCNEQYNEYRDCNERYNCDGRDKRFVVDKKEKGKERDFKDKPKAYIIDSNNETSIALFCLLLFI